MALCEVAESSSLQGCALLSDCVLCMEGMGKKLADRLYDMANTIEE